MPWVRFLLVLTCFLICSLRAEAAPAPIVFNFEDGLQGWELSGSAQRVQTQILGGEWAIFGDGLLGETSISIDLDITNVRSISVEQFFAGDASLSFLGTSFLSIVVDSVRGVAGTLLSQSTANPGTRAFGLGGPGFEGVSTITFLWRPIGFVVDCLPSPCPPLPPDHRLGFIDNITFHPVPEPSTLALLAISLGAILIARQRVG